MTKCKHALDCFAQVTGELVYNLWAVEPAKTTHIRYTCSFLGGSRKHLYWKMSIHLLEVSMVQHGSFDGLITYHQLQRTAQKFAQSPEDTVLRTEIAKMTALCEDITRASVR